MKAAQNILKIIAIVAAIGTVACLVVAYWDRIVNVFYNISDKIEAKRAKYGLSCECNDFEEAVL